MSIYEFSPPPVAVGGVTSLNSLTGALSLLAGTGITLTPAGNTLTIASAAAIGIAGAIQYSDGIGGLTAENEFAWDATNSNLLLGAPGQGTPESHGFISINAESLTGDIAMLSMRNGSSQDFGVDLMMNIDVTGDFLIKRIESDVAFETLRIARATGIVTAATGLSSPAFKLSTTPTAGYVLTSDASGNGSWQAAGGGGGTPSDYIFSNTSGQSWNGDGPGLLVDSATIGASGFSPSYLGTSDVPVGNSTVASTSLTIQTGFILEPTSTKDSGLLEILTGFSAGAGGQSGQVDIYSGDFTNSLATSGYTGNTRLFTGSTFALAGDSGNTLLFSGNSVHGKSGNIELTIGSAGTTKGVIKLDAMIIASNSLNENYNGPGAGVLVDTVANASNSVAYFGGTDVPLGDTTHGYQYTVFKTGSILEPTSAQSSGPLQIITGDNLGLGQTGDVTISSGGVYGATANAGPPGNINLFAGTNQGLVTNGSGGNVQLNSGNCVNSVAGNINIGVGTGVGSIPGKINLTGPVVVGGSLRVSIRTITTSDTLNAYRDQKLLLNDPNVLNTNTVTLPVGVDGLTFTTKGTATNQAGWSFVASGGNTIDQPGGFPPDPTGTVLGPCTLTFLTGVWYVI